MYNQSGADRHGGGNDCYCENGIRDMHIRIDCKTFLEPMLGSYWNGFRVHFHYPLHPYQEVERQLTAVYYSLQSSGYAEQ